PSRVRPSNSWILPLTRPLVFPLTLLDSRTFGSSNSDCLLVISSFTLNDSPPLCSARNSDPLLLVVLVILNDSRLLCSCNNPASLILTHSLVLSASWLLCSSRTFLLTLTRSSGRSSRCFRTGIVRSVSAAFTPFTT